MNTDRQNLSEKFDPAEHIETLNRQFEQLTGKPAPGVGSLPVSQRPLRDMMWQQFIAERQDEAWVLWHQQFGYLQQPNIQTLPVDFAQATTQKPQIWPGVGKARRKVEEPALDADVDPGEGYRLLNEGEMVLATDEVWMGTWMSRDAFTLNNGIPYNRKDSIHSPTRRKVEPAYPRYFKVIEEGVCTNDIIKFTSPNDRSEIYYHYGHPSLGKDHWCSCAFHVHEMTNNYAVEITEQEARALYPAAFPQPGLKFFKDWDGDYYVQEPGQKQARMWNDMCKAWGPAEYLVAEAMCCKLTREQIVELLGEEAANVAVRLERV